MKVKSKGLDPPPSSSTMEDAKREMDEISCILTYLYWVLYKPESNGLYNQKESNLANTSENNAQKVSIVLKTAQKFEKKWQQK